MKKLLIAIMLAVPFTLLAQDKSFTLKGKLGNVSAPAKVYLGHDSTTIINGEFEFQGTVNDPITAILALNYKGNRSFRSFTKYLTIFLEPGNITISSPDSLNHATIKGSKVNADNEILNEALKPIKQKRLALMSELRALPQDKKNDKDVIAAITKREKMIDEEQNLVILDFIRKNPDSFVSFYQLEDQDVGGDFPDYNVVAPLFNSLSPAIKNTASGKAYAKSLEVMKVTAIGSMAPSFTQNDPDGKPISLASFNGKYVLIDFWASWCSLCRAENPNVVEAYRKYHDKGLEIISVSLDDIKSKEAWLEAIKKDGLTWYQVCDLKGMKNEVAELYHITLIPQNLLLDKTGKIIARNLRGQELSKKLDGVFN